MSWHIHIYIYTHIQHIHICIDADTRVQQSVLAMYRSRVERAANKQLQPAKQLPLCFGRDFIGVRVSWCLLSKLLSPALLSPQPQRQTLMKPKCNSGLHDTLRRPFKTPAQLHNIS